MDPTELNATVVAEVTPRGDLINAIKDLVEDQQRAHVVGIKDPVSGKATNVILAPDGTVTPLPASTYEDYLDEPRYRRGTSTLTSLDSFIAISNRFRDDHSAVFACDDRDKPSLTTVFDYNPANVHGGEGVGIEESRPRFGRHRARFAFPLSDEWQAWNAANAQQMDMPTFAAFLEDRIVDVAAPGELPLNADQQKFIDRIGGRDLVATPSDLITLSRGLKINENATITNEVNLASGEGQIHFGTEHTDASGAPLRIPTSFVLAIPAFRNDALYAVVARLRYRPRPVLRFFYELYGVERIFDHAFHEATQKVNEATGLPIYLGSPEA